MIQVTCKICREVLNIPDQYAGQSGKCQKCGSSLQVPSPSGGFVPDNPPPVPPQLSESSNRPSPPPMPAEDNKPPRKRSVRQKGCLMLVGGFLIVNVVLIYLGSLSVRESKGEIANADQFWVEGEYNEAVDIYKRELQFVEKSYLPEVYRRIIFQLHDRGDKGEAIEYCNKALREGLDIEFASEALRSFFADARHEGTESRRPNREETDAFRETFVGFPHEQLIVGLKSNRYGPPWKLTITVNEEWDALSYETRLEYAKNFRGAWQGVWPPEPGGADTSIELVNEAGEVKTAVADLEKAESQVLVRENLDAYLAILNASEVTVVKDIRVERNGDMWTATLTVDNLWHLKLSKSAFKMRRLCGRYGHASLRPVRRTLRGLISLT